MSVSGIVTAPGSAAESVAVTVTLSPGRTGLRGETESSTVGVSSSSMVTATEAGEPGATVDGRFAVSSATVNVSSSVSPSWRVAMRPVPAVAPAPMRMFASVPRSSASALPRVTVSGIVTARGSVRGERRRNRHALPPPPTGFGAAESVTVGVACVCACRVTVTV